MQLQDKLLPPNFRPVETLPGMFPHLRSQSCSFHDTTRSMSGTSVDGGPSGLPVLRASVRARRATPRWRRSVCCFPVEGGEEERLGRHLGLFWPYIIDVGIWFRMSLEELTRLSWGANGSKGLLEISLLALGFVGSLGLFFGASRIHT